MIVRIGGSAGALTHEWSDRTAEWSGDAGERSTLGTAVTPPV